MAGLARFFLRIASDPLEIAIHNLGAFSDTGPHIYHPNIEYIELLKKAVDEIDRSEKSWIEKESYYDRIAGKVVKSNRVNLVRSLYHGGVGDQDLVDGTGRTQNGIEFVKHIGLLSALVRRGVHPLPVNIHGMAIIRSQVLDRTDSIPDTLRYVDNAIRSGADINEILNGITMLDQLLFGVESEDIPHETRRQFQRLIGPLQERGARRFSEITQTPDQIRSIVDKQGIKRELYNVARSTAFHPAGSFHKEDVFGIPAVCRFLDTEIPRTRGLPLAPFFVIVKNLLYIYVDVEPVAYVYGYTDPDTGLYVLVDPATRGYVLEFRDASRPTDRYVDIEEAEPVATGGAAAAAANREPALFNVPKQPIYGSPNFEDAITLDRIPEGTEVLRITGRRGANPNISTYPIPQVKSQRLRFLRELNSTRINTVTRAPFTPDQIQRGPYRYRPVAGAGAVVPPEAAAPPAPAVPAEPAVPAVPAVPVAVPAEEVIRRLRRMPDLLQQLDFMKDGHDASGRRVTTIADMPATYTASTNDSSDDVFIVNGTVKIRIKNGITASTESDDIAMGPIPAARRRKTRVNRTNRTRRTRRTSRRNHKS